MNRVFLTGNITKKPELIATTSNVALTRITLAVRRDKDNTDFIDLKAFGKIAETLVTWADKGTKIGVEAHISTGSYEKDGKKIKTTDILIDSFEFLSKASESTPKAESPKNEPIPEPTEVLSSDADLPF